MTKRCQVPDGMYWTEANMNISELLKKTEEYLNGDFSEHNKSLASMFLTELIKIEEDDSYIVPSNVMRKIMDSFDFSTKYWKKYFTQYWDSNLEKLEAPFK